MNRGGSPDVQRGARQIIKDYLNGKLIYAYPPPGYDERTFQEFKVNPIKEAKYFDKNKKKSHLESNFFAASLSFFIYSKNRLIQ